MERYRVRATTAVAVLMAAGFTGLTGVTGLTGYSATGRPDPAAAPAAPQPAAAAVARAAAQGVRLPPDQIAPPPPACATAPRPAGWAAAENRRPGERGWQRTDAASTTVKAYLGEVSAVCGETVDLHVSGRVRTASATAYRIGWYGGAGARRVWSASGIPVSQYPVTLSGAPRYLAEAEWPVALRFTVTPDWTPGFYVLDVRGPGETAGGEAIPFVVRDAGGPSGSGTSPLLFQAAVLTYQAYNDFGSYSMYEGPRDKTPAASDRSRVASFDRPYAGSGYQAPFLYDVPLAQTVERLGLDVDYTTDVDVDRRPSQVAAHRALLIGGHSEYWTRRMYDAAEFARDHGVNLAFFGANTVYWHARLETSPSGPERRMAVYRQLNEDPLAAADPAQATVTWRAAPLNRPEAALVGADFGSYKTVGGGFRVLDPGSWIFAGTGMTFGRTLPGSLAGEFDTVRDGSATPAGIEVLAAAPVWVFGNPTMATMSYYTAPSGAGVFSAGTTYWPCQVAGACEGYAVSPEASRVFGVMTANVLTAFEAGPAALLHPAVHRPAPNATGLIGSAASPRDVAVRIP